MGNVMEQGGPSYVIFDSQCAFCNAGALWIARHDRNKELLLVSSQSDTGRRLLAATGLRRYASQTIVYAGAGGQVAMKSRAIRGILQHIPAWKRLDVLFSVFPPSLLDLLYRGVSKIRKKLPGRTICKLPEASIRDRFVL